MERLLLKPLLWTKSNEVAALGAAPLALFRVPGVLLFVRAEFKGVGPDDLKPPAISSLLPHTQIVSVKRTT